MDNKSFSQSKEEGKRTWKALQNQWGEALGFFGAMFSSLLLFIKKQALWFILFAVIFGTFGGVYAWMKKPVYHSEMTVSYAQLEKKIYADMLFKLNQLLESKQYESLGFLLNMSVDQVKQIHLIDSKNIRYEPLVNDISIEKVPFYIIVDVYDPDILPELEEQLVNYISVSDFVYERLQLNERNYRNEIIHMKNQMIYMDSLKTMLLSDCSNLDADAVVNLENLNKNQNEIFGRIRDLEAALQFNKNIEIMDGFIAQEIPLSNIIIRFILLGMIVGIGLRLFWLMVK